LALPNITLSGECGNKPLDAKPHRRWIAIFRGLDHRLHDSIGVILHDFLAKNRGAVAGSWRLASGIAGLSFFEHQRCFPLVFVTSLNALVSFSNTLAFSSPSSNAARIISRLSCANCRAAIGATLKAFYYYVERIWLRTLQRRSQKDRFSWQRMHRLAADWIPKPRILHPYPDKRFAVTHPRLEPCAGIPPARISAGGGQ
jgi:hypothetical protein